MPAYEDIKRLVGIVIAKREPFDHHGSRVAAFAMNLASALQLSQEKIELIETGAHLHDIGKIFVPTEVLNATRPLNSVERTQVETHAHMGWDVVHDAGYDQVIQNIVRHHHEWWNGKGYPDGLAGNEIPIEAQIVGICDCYDALTSKRTYRDAFSHQFAMAFIQKDKRSKFNPELVDLFFMKVARG